MYKIFQEFNADKRTEILQMILGGNLTAEGGKYGTKALGEVQERKWDTVIEAKADAPRLTV